MPPAHLRSADLTDLGATAEEIGRLRWTLRQVVTLADNPPTSTDQQRQDRLLALTERERPNSVGRFDV